VKKEDRLLLLVSKLEFSLVPNILVGNTCPNLIKIFVLFFVPAKASVLFCLARKVPKEHTGIQERSLLPALLPPERPVKRLVAEALFFSFFSLLKRKGHIKFVYNIP